MENKNTFTVLDNEGKEVTCDVLFTFESEETGKTYMAYTDNTLDEQGNVKVYASIIDPNSEEISLEPITSDKEWEIIDNILESLAEESEKNEQ